MEFCGKFKVGDILKSNPHDNYMELGGDVFVKVINNHSNRGNYVRVKVLSSTNNGLIGEEFELFRRKFFKLNGKIR